MAVKWISAGREKHGLKYREHLSETIGIGKNKRPLRYYKAVVKIDGRAMSDVFGWENEIDGGRHRIEQLALELKINRKAKTPPFTYREMLEDRKKELHKEKEAEILAREEDKRLERTLFENMFEEYISFKQDTRSSREMRGFYKNWLAPHLGKKRLDQIVLMDLQKVQKKMENAGRAPRTIKTIKEVVRQVYNFAISHDLYNGAKPTDNFLKNQKLNNQRVEYYSYSQAESLLAKLKGKSLQTYRISSLSLNTGMRFGEIACLLWQHVNVERKSIVVVDPKNAESRVVYMVDEVAEMFSEMVRGEPSDLVFPDSNGNIMKKVSNTFPKAIKKLKFNEGVSDRRLKLGFHSLRHTAASWMANKGIEMHVIAKVLGHKTLAMTMRYSHINDQTVKDAMAVLEKRG